MDWWHPDRPRQANGAPMYIDRHGRPIAALQGLTVEPRSDGSYTVALMLCVGEGEFGWKECVATDLPVLMDCIGLYTLDPETFMRNYLDYEPPVHARGYRPYVVPPEPREPARHQTHPTGADLLNYLALLPKEPPNDS